MYLYNMLLVDLSVVTDTFLYLPQETYFLPLTTPGNILFSDSAAASAFGLPPFTQSSNWNRD